MKRDFAKAQPEVAKKVSDYIDSLSEPQSNTEIARHIFDNYPDVNLSFNYMRLLIGSVKRNKGHYGRVEAVANHHGVNPNDIKHLWVKDKESSIFIKNPDFKQEEYNQFKEDLMESIKDHSPIYPKLIRDKSSDGHLLIIDPADIHLGKMCDSMETGEDYNNQIAVQRVKEGVQGIINKSYGFNIDKILFIGGNDILHVDTPRNTTTSGTGQDVSAMWYRSFLDAKKLYVEVIEMLLSLADIHFCYNPSNHDYTNGFFLADVIQTHFRNCENISFDCSIAHRKYYLYGNSLIGTTHGDGAKNADLGSLMSVEAKHLWAKSEHRYFYTHHVHHKVSKDFINVTVEAVRSPSGTDSWHHRNGYTGAPKAIEGFIHHKEHGQLSRITHIF